VKVQERLKRSRRQEKEGMERFGGVRNPRSGARWDRRNDGRTSFELVEFKRTDNQRCITINYTDLVELHRHAVVEDRIPVLGFDLGGDHFVVLPEREYFELSEHRRRSGPAADPDPPLAALDGTGQVQGGVRLHLRQPLVRRSPAQRSGSGGQVGVPGHPPGPPRPLPGPRRLSRVRPRQRREVGGLGRVLRKRAAPDQEGPPS
jgi:hypothetical protein